MTTRKARVALVGATGLLLALAGALCAYGEAATLLVPRASAGTIFERMSAPIPQFQFSIDAHIARLHDCIAVADSVFAQALPEPQRDQFFDNCEAFALDAAKEAPTFSLPWAVAAYFAAKRQGWSDFNN
jgi:hypothetical protein